jgi:uncharacterized protein YbjT (DUF2867 family)
MRRRFRVVSVQGEKAVVAARSDNFHFEVSARQPALDGKKILLEAGQDFEAVVVGQCDSFRDVSVDDGLQILRSKRR